MIGDLYQAKVFISLKKSVYDPQGDAVKKGLHSLGFSQVEAVRLGKYMELHCDGASLRQAEEQVRQMCEQLLANTVIEQYSFEVQEVKK